MSVTSAGKLNSKCYINAKKTKKILESKRRKAYLHCSRTKFSSSKSLSEK